MTKRYAYQCPVCNSYYENEAEAEDCLESCQPEIEVIELAQDEFVEDEEIVKKGSCHNCEHSDCDKHRCPPCPKHHFAKPVPADACQQYAPATHY